jgi:hypothetical protein
MPREIAVDREAMTVSVSGAVRCEELVCSLGRPHESIARLYPRLQHFVELLGCVDARGAFRNEWLKRRVPGA